MRRSFLMGAGRHVAIGAMLAALGLGLLAGQPRAASTAAGVGSTGGPSVWCCLPDGSCALMPTIACLTNGGSEIPGPCAGDGNGNGIDDACEGMGPLFLEAAIDLARVLPASRLDFATDPIPADFFFPGSEPFAGIIPVGGRMINPNHSNASMIIRRVNDVSLPQIGSADIVPIELLELNLVSVNPVVISGVPFDVTVTDETNATGQMNLLRDQPTGGLFEYQFFDLVLSVRFVSQDETIDRTWIQSGPIGTAAPSSWSQDPPPQAPPGTNYSYDSLSRLVRPTADLPFVNAVSRCRGDTNGDGVVNITDLLAVLGSWGACGICPADLNGDGVVNIIDLLLVLSGWGPCSWGPQFYTNWDNGVKEIDYWIINGAPNRTYTVSGAATGISAKFQGGPDNITTNGVGAGEGDVNVICNGAGCTSFTITFTQGDVSSTSQPICIECENGTAPPKKVKCPCR